ncbi:MAG TPA: Rpp14/Pop5 family protein [Candidatus Diapherotrites archaeon]|jgi:RNase P/RNase MRP subunit POP5|nr:Rpp14/Pop5 family protein [Candidatus Diapherotrites archaeon]
MKKKKLAVIRPNLRHKKRYVHLELLTYPHALDSKTVYSSLSRALQKQSGIFVQLEANITIIEMDFKAKTILIRVNKDYLEEFLASLFFAQQDLGLLKIKNIKSTIKKIGLK